MIGSPFINAKEKATPAPPKGSAGGLLYSKESGRMVSAPT